MRTLTKVTTVGLTRENSDRVIRDWLHECGFSPETVNLSEPVKTALLKNDEVSQEGMDLTHSHATEILLSIPRHDQERRHALNTAKYLIHFADNVHGMDVWGLVCIEHPNVAFRWRHRSSKSLERATEELVRKVWEVSESGSTFAPFAPEQSIPVREPLSVADAYVGKVLPPGKLMKARARLDKKAELQLARWFAFITLACFVVGGILFDVSRADSRVRWLSGAFDRLATAAAVTWVVSYLNYYFYLRELESKPIVDWQ